MLVAQDGHGGGGSLVRWVHLCRCCDFRSAMPTWYHWLHGYGISVALAFATVVVFFGQPQVQMRSGSVCFTRGHESLVDGQAYCGDDRFGSRGVVCRAVALVVGLTVWPPLDLAGRSF